MVRGSQRLYERFFRLVDFSITYQTSLSIKVALLKLKVASRSSCDLGSLNATRSTRWIFFPVLIPCKRSRGNGQGGPGTSSGKD
jgi:hypothetical protein